jgi:hypothetical protein
MRKNKIIYSINIEDVQNVAQQELGRYLTVEELRIIEDKIGDQFDWYGAIASVLDQHITVHESSNEEDCSLLCPISARLT